ncbi:putative Heterokaryon incompatibility domain-containing protein [Seiridium cardinale]
MPLCAHCTRLPPVTEWTPITHYTFKTLQLSAGNDCELCRVIWQTLRGLGSTEDILADEPDKVSVVLSIPPLKGAQYPEWRHAYQTVFVSPDTSGEAGGKIGLFSKQGEKGPALIDGREIAPSHGSAGTYEFIQETLHKCLCNHSECSKNVDVELPTYVVDVGLDHDAACVKIVRSYGANGSYIALSYCWGGPQHMQLTNKTLKSFQQGLTVSRLPKTLRDAITVTRQLGHRYLWVDALCIVQDDQNSKQLELGKMSQTYKNSFVTIQPSVSKNADEGFLNLRTPPPPPARLIFQDSPETGKLPVYARTLELPPRLTHTSERAWIFQESVLPPRLLSYTASQVFISCREQRQSEDRIQSALSQISPYLYRDIRPDLYNAKSGEPDAVRASALKSWYSMISLHYSPRLHSVSEDRLGALAAYAQEVHRPIGGNYLAGLWDVDLLKGLGWRRVKKTLELAIPYRAPSWSWAAYDGQIAWWGPERRAKSPNLHFQPRVVEAWTDFIGESQYGACRDGRLVLETLVGSASALEVFKGMKREFIMATEDGTEEVCQGLFDTIEATKTFTCAIMTQSRGLLLVADGSAFRRIGTFSVTNHVFSKDKAVIEITRNIPFENFEKWANTCEFKQITLI